MTENHQAKNAISWHQNVLDLAYPLLHLTFFFKLW